MRVIVAGSRSFLSSEVLSERLDFFLGSKECEIVSGSARGADRLGEVYARQRGLAVKVFPAEWDRYGKRAGYLRNESMAVYATHLVAFWDGVSAGTGHMIQLATKHGLVVRVVRV